MKKPGKTLELTTSAQMAAWRQRLDIETKSCKNQTHEEIARMNDLLNTKNTYLHYFKKDNIRMQDEEEEKQKHKVRIA